MGEWIHTTYMCQTYIQIVTMRIAAATKLSTKTRKKAIAIAAEFGSPIGCSETSVEALIKII